MENNMEDIIIHLIHGLIILNNIIKYIHKKKSIIQIQFMAFYIRKSLNFMAFII